MSGVLYLVNVSFFSDCLDESFLPLLVCPMEKVVSLLALMCLIEN